MLLSPRRRWFRSHRRPHVLFSQLLLLALFILLLFMYSPHQLWLQQSNAHSSTSDPPSRPPNPFLHHQAKFWRALYQIILNNDPQCEYPPDLVVPTKLDITFDPSHQHPRPDVLWIEAHDLKRLTEAHSNFIRDLRSAAPDMVYQPGTRGIVTTAHYAQLPVLVIGIRMLRRTGSLLPVEVFLSTSIDYDAGICESVLPSLNARCIVMSDIFHAADSGVALQTFQYKILSILFCSFEDVLLLDSDAYPIYDPTTLFDTEPFNTTGMITWPDFWYASESPYYFEIAKLGPPPPLNVRPSTESGEIMVSKGSHAHTLMLAAYYNYYGPQYYYPLQSQGAPGQGDKETFGWAAQALAQPSYAVHEPVIALGNIDSSGEFFGSAMAQHDPAEDFRRFQRQNLDEDSNFGSPQTGEVPDAGKSSSHGVRPFFIHANYPKFDPSTIFDAQILGAKGPTRDTNGTSVRCWVDEAFVTELFGFDLEKRFWQEIKGVACEYEHMFGWKGRICNRVRKYYTEIFGPE